MADKDEKREEHKLESFRTEYRKLIGGAIIEGLISPAAALSTLDPSFAAAGNHDQNGGGYTQSGGDYDQVVGDYNQSELVRNLDIVNVDLERLSRVRSESS